MSKIVQDHLESLAPQIKSNRTASIAECCLDLRIPDTINVDSDDELIALAKSKINVFPYKSVEARWFRLFTDASLSEAVEILRDVDFDDGRLERETVLQDAVSLLDNVLIIAGGGEEGRKEMLHGIFKMFEEVLVSEGADGDELLEERPAKRRRVGDLSGLDDTIEHGMKRRVLPSSLSPCPPIEYPVIRLDQPSLTRFEEHATKSRTPVVLENTLGHWRAMMDWKDESYWLRRTLGGARLVPVEIGQSYNDEDWRQEVMPFKLFLSQYIMRDDGKAGDVGYLAQHDLLTQIPSLRADIAVPDYCYVNLPVSTGDDFGKDYEHDLNGDQDKDPEIHQNIWFGGRTVSPLHHDPYHNILCQVHGTKYIRLYAPENTPKLYPRSKTEPAPHLHSKAGVAEGTNSENSHSPTSSPSQTSHGDSPITARSETIDMSNNSTVDVYAMQLSPHEDWDAVWPGISQVPYLECVLEAGQALYIPKSWWHYVRGLNASGISVSFWW